MGKLRLFLVIVGVLFAYYKGFNTGFKNGRLFGERKALADAGVDRETILSQTS